MGDVAHRQPDGIRERGSMPIRKTSSIHLKRGDNMTVLIVSKTAMSSGEIKSVKNIAFNSSTNVYTLTLEDNTTQTYSAVNYYLTVLWTW